MPYKNTRKFDCRMQADERFYPVNPLRQTASR